MTINQIVLSASLFLPTILLTNCTSTKHHEVPANHAGVVYDAVEGLKDTLLASGAHEVPLSWEITHYPTQEQITIVDMKVLSQGALEVTVSFDVTTQLKKESLPELHKMFRENYVETYITPEARSVCRQVCGDLYVEDITIPTVSPLLSEQLQSKLDRFNFFDKVEVSEIEISIPVKHWKRIDVRIRNISKNFKTSSKEQKKEYILELFNMDLSESKRLIYALLEEEDLDDELKQLITLRFEEKAAGYD